MVFVCIHLRTGRGIPYGLNGTVVSAVLVQWTFLDWFCCGCVLFLGLLVLDDSNPALSSYKYSAHTCVQYWWFTKLVLAMYASSRLVKSLLAATLLEDPCPLIWTYAAVSYTSKTSKRVVGSQGMPPTSGQLLPRLSKDIRPAITILRCSCYLDT